MKLQGGMGSNYQSQQNKMPIVTRNRSVIPACDVPLQVFAEIVGATHDIDGIGGYKIGPALTGRIGYDVVVRLAKAKTDKPLIFDAQKWGTDIPDTAPKLLGPLREAGVDAVILFPFSGPATQHDWIRTAQDLGLGVLVGGEMTHPRAIEGDYTQGKKVDYTTIFRDLGFAEDLTGYMRRGAPAEIFTLAAKMGVTDFVVPGNKPDAIRGYRDLIERGCGIENAAYWSPGLVAQGGEITEGAEAAGERFHAIVGRGIYQAEDKRAAALDLVSKL